MSVKGMYWLMALPPKERTALHVLEAVECFTEVHGRAPVAMSVPRDEGYTTDYGQIRVRVRGYVPPWHIFMWLDEPEER